MNKKLKKECESNSEYLLPDYMGDIKKLISTKAVAVTTGKFVGEGSIEVSGNVEYDLLYLDTEGKLTAVNTSSDFSETFAVDTEKHIDSNEESRVCALKVRVTGPRKISLKADVETAICISEENEVGVEGDVFSEESERVEKASSSVTFASSVFARSGEREYAEIAEQFEGVNAEQTEIVSVHGTSLVKEAISGDGEVTLRGENIVSAIVNIYERPPLMIKKAIPFEEIIPVEGASVGMNAIAQGFVSSADVGLGADGEHLNAVANVISEYNVELIGNETATVVTDAYTVDGECRNKYSEREFSELLFAGTKSFTVDIKCNKADEKLTELCDVISIDADVRPAGAVIDKSGVEFSGEITVSGVGYETNVDGSVSYLPIRVQNPFSQNVGLDCQIEEGNSIDYKLSVCDCEVTNDEETLSIRCLIVAKMYVFSPRTLKTLVSCERIEGEKSVRDASVITVYYPKAGEKLFDVAKRYKTTSAKIARDNFLSESALASFDSADSLVGVKKLIIR